MTTIQLPICAVNPKGTLNVDTFDVVDSITITANTAFLVLSGSFTLNGNVAATGYLPQQSETILVGTGKVGLIQ